MISSNGFCPQHKDIGFTVLRVKKPGNIHIEESGIREFGLDFSKNYTN